MFRSYFDIPWFVLTADLSLFVYAATYRSNGVRIWGGHVGVPLSIFMYFNIEINILD